jgi:glucose/arabinose dehydrogenase
VTGGYAYRGARIPALVGAYVWGDYGLDQLNALVVQDGAVVAQRDLDRNVPQLSSFGEDSEGELLGAVARRACVPHDPCVAGRSRTLPRRMALPTFRILGAARRANVLKAALVAVVLASCSSAKLDDATAGTDGLGPGAAPIDLAAVDVGLQEVAQVDEPTAFAARPGDSAVFITERAGRVRRIDATGTAGEQRFALDPAPVLDISDEVTTAGVEQGLLGITFSADGNRMYIGYTSLDGNQHLDEYLMSGEEPVPLSRREVLVIQDPNEIHNSGAMMLGPDGFLYWGMGDGGGGGDPRRTGQDPTDLLGALLRIDPAPAPPDVDAGRNYSIPADNPFRLGGGAPEVWAYGLRNPWRFSFDRATGDLWIGDVGQERVEEIDFLPADGGTGAGQGANLGWSDVEGDRIREGSTVPDGAVDPVLVYEHNPDNCAAVTGGYVYRGTRIAALIGAYVWGDHCSGDVQALVVRDGALVAGRSLDVTVPQLTSFGEDNDGELWLLSLAGPVFRLIPA